MNRLNSILVGVDFSGASRHCPRKRAERGTVSHSTFQLQAVSVERQRQAVMTGAGREPTRWLGNKGRNDLRYVLLGSAAERLLTKLPCSVLCVRPPEGRSA